MDVSEAECVADCCAITSTIIGIGKTLRHRVVAEGVETAEQAGFMRALGCRTAQGYLYARPMPLQVLKEWLAQYKG